MNLGISNSQVSTWKRIKTQHLIAAAGVALAVSVVIGGVSLRDGKSTPAAPRSVAPASIARQAPLPETFVYIVGSQAEAAELTSGIANASEEVVDSTSRQVFVVDSLKAEADLATMQGELFLAGTADTVRIVDLRGGAPLPAFGSRPAEYVQVVTPEAEMLSTGLTPSWATTIADGPVHIQVVTPEAEMLSTGINPSGQAAPAASHEYVEHVTPEAEMLSTGINPSGQAAPAANDEYVEHVTPEAEMLSVGMNLP